MNITDTFQCHTPHLDLLDLFFFFPSCNISHSPIHSSPWFITNIWCFPHYYLLSTIHKYSYPIFLHNYLFPRITLPLLSSLSPFLSTIHYYLYPLFLYYYLCPAIRLPSATHCSPNQPTCSRGQSLLFPAASHPSVPFIHTNPTAPRPCSQYFIFQRNTQNPEIGCRITVPADARDQPTPKQGSASR